MQRVFNDFVYVPDDMAEARLEAADTRYSSKAVALQDWSDVCPSKMWPRVIFSVTGSSKLQALKPIHPILIHTCSKHFRITDRHHEIRVKSQTKSRMTIASTVMSNVGNEHLSYHTTSTKRT